MLNLLLYLIDKKQQKTANMAIMASISLCLAKGEIGHPMQSIKTKNSINRSDYLQNIVLPNESQKTVQLVTLLDVFSFRFGKSP